MNRYIAFFAIICLFLFSCTTWIKPHFRSTQDENKNNNTILESMHLCNDYDTDLNNAYVCSQLRFKNMTDHNWQSEVTNGCHFGEVLDDLILHFTDTENLEDAIKDTKCVICFIEEAKLFDIENQELKDKCTGIYQTIQDLYVYEVCKKHLSKAKGHLKSLEVRKCCHNFLKANLLDHKSPLTPAIDKYEDEACVGDTKSKNESSSETLLDSTEKNINNY